MIQLNVGNVLLKPSHRKQVMASLRRAMKIGQRLGNFMLDLRMSRCGRNYEVRAIVRDSAGEFTCHSRRHDWRGAIRELTRMLVSRLHQQWIMRSAVAA
jgi:hypothetical protein